MKRILRYIPTILAAGVITYFSLLREPHFRIIPPITIPHIDKLVHLLMYMFLSAVFSFDLKRDKQTMTVILTLSVLVPTIYGGIIEILQERFFYPRTGEWLDWAADAIGALIGIYIYIVLTKYMYKNITEQNSRQ